MLCEEHDLADVIGSMCREAIDRLVDVKGFAANGDGSFEIFRCKGLDLPESNRPAFFPPADDVFPRHTFRHFKLGVVVSVGLLAVGCQEIPETRAEVAGQVFDDDRDAVRVRIDECVEVGVRDLRQRAIAERFVIAKRANEVGKVA